MPWKSQNDFTIFIINIIILNTFCFFIGTIGPVAVSFDGSNLSSYSGGIYSDPDCDSTKNSHSGLIVGYGTTDDGIEYWTVKMSYGESWGENGYVRIPRNANNYCGIAQNAIYPLL